MVEKMNGLSRELIIHPGETLKDILVDRGMTQAELAKRTGVSGKHISNVVNGLSPITANFAKKLEYVFDVEAEFWTNLQTIYDNELQDYEEKIGIQEEEFSIIKTLKDVIKYLEENNLIKKGLDKVYKVIEIRKFLNVSNLTAIPSLTVSGAFRGSENCSYDPYVLFAWQKICEVKTNLINVEDELNIEKLESAIPYIKSLMFLEPNKMHEELIKIFSECGIAFEIIKHFKGAPVQGYITKNSNETLSLCMTIRNSYADIFWFSLFHEISHILNGDVSISKRFIDFDFTKDDTEIKADNMAGNFLIQDESYNEFVENNDFSLSTIQEFSRKNKVAPFVTIGRLQKDNHISYQMFSSHKPRYKWV